MTQSRQSQVSLSDTPSYPCISRCVRRAYLCVKKRFWMFNDFSFSKQRGAISNHRSRLLSTLGLDDVTLLSLASSFGNDYHGAVSSLEALALFASYTGKRWIASKNQLRLH